MTTLFTRLLRLAKPDFRDSTWSPLINENMDTLDSVVQKIYAGANIVSWANATSFDIGDVVVDVQVNPPTYWVCGVDHISANAPTTFAQDRIAHPSYWSAFLELPQRIKLTSNLVMWVRSDGDDAHTGLNNNKDEAKATWNGAYTELITNYDFCGFTVTISSGTTNTYTRGLFMASSWIGGGSLIIDLNGSSIAETVTKGIIQNCIQPGLVTIQNSKGLGVGGGIASLGYSGIQISQPGELDIGVGITIGSCGGSCLEAASGGLLALTNPINLNGSGGRTMLITSSNGRIGCNGQAVNIFNNQTYTNYVVNAQYSSNISVDAVAFNLNGHTITGNRYYVDQDSVIYTNNGGENFIPGSAPGLCTNGGLYDGKSSAKTYRANSLITSDWQLDCSGGQSISLLASTNTGDLPIGGGILAVIDNTTTGNAALFVIIAGNAYLVGGGAFWSNTTTPAANKGGVGYSGTGWRVYNGSGATRSFTITGIKMLPSV